MKNALTRGAALMGRRSTLGGLLAFVLFASFGFGMSIPSAGAAALTNLSDTQSSSKVSTASSHVIKFTTPSGASSTSATITITFPSDFNFTSKSTTTLTLTYGTTTGSEITASLAATSTTNVFGVAFSGTQNR